MPDEAYYRQDEYAEIRSAFLAHLERVFGLVGVDQVAERATRVMAVETRARSFSSGVAGTADTLTLIAVLSRISSRNNEGPQRPLSERPPHPGCLPTLPIGLLLLSLVRNTDVFSYS